VGTILTHTGSAYAAALNSDEIVGVVSEVDNTNDFTIQTHGRIDGLSLLTAGTQYYVSDSSSGTATSTDTDTPIYIAISTTEAVINTYIESSGGGGSGDWEFISENVIGAAVSAVQFTGLSSTYKYYVIKYKNFTPSAAGNGLYVTTSSDGVSFDTGASDYAYIHNETPVGGSESSFTSGGTSSIFVAGNTGNSSGQSSSGEIHIYGHDTSSYPTYIEATNQRERSTGVFVSADARGTRKSNGLVQGIEISPILTNMASGTFKLYGIK
jgi:hypothetical protein